MAQQGQLSAWFTLAFLVVAVCSGHARAAETPLQYYLWEIASTEDCYFTIEEAYEEGEMSNRIRSHQILPQSERRGIEADLDYISKNVPGIIIVQDARAPHVFHILDKRVVALKHYALETTVAHFRYSGKLYAILLALQKTVSNIGPALGAMIGDDVPDFTSEVNVAPVRDVPVRDMLCIFLPLSEYARVLWVAETRLSDPPRTLVKFLGPRAKTDSTQHNPPFTSGDIGWKAQLRSLVQCRHSEIGVLVNSLASESITPGQDTRNTRRVMRFLGEYRDTEATPILVGHIEWQFCAWGVLEESYPAVYALSNIGKPATVEILKQLPKDKDALRRGLMCEVLRKVEGNKYAILMVEDTLAELKDPGEKKNVEAALNCLRKDGPIVDPLLPKDKHAEPKQEK